MNRYYVQLNEQMSTTVEADFYSHDAYLAKFYKRTGGGTESLIHSAEHPVYVKLIVEEN